MSVIAAVLVFILVAFFHPKLRRMEAEQGIFSKIHGIFFIFIKRRLSCIYIIKIKLL